MGDYTSRYGFYLPGGGSTGTVTPDEPVDIDKINDNFRKLDLALGLTVVPDANLPSSAGTGQIFKATTTDVLLYWDGAHMQPVLPQRLLAGNMASTYYTKTDLGGGALDTRYYTQTRLLNDGVLDSRYPAKSAAGSVTKSMLPFKLLWGTGLMQNLALDSTTGTYNRYQDITFSTPFSTPPTVVASANSADSGGVTCQYVNLTNTGVRIYLNRRNQVDTGFDWFAIGT